MKDIDEELKDFEEGLAKLREGIENAMNELLGQRGIKGYYFRLHEISDEEHKTMSPEDIAWNRGPIGSNPGSLGERCAGEPAMILSGNPRNPQPKSNPLYWTDEEEALIKAHFGTPGWTRNIEDLTGRDSNAVRQKAHRMGLRLNPKARR